MDKEQEKMQFLGAHGIYSEACKIIYSCRKIFTQITLALIFPLTFFVLAHYEVNQILYAKIVYNAGVLDETGAVDTSRYEKKSDLVYSEWAGLLLINSAYLIILPLLTLLSTSAVVYTIACAYTGQNITFKKVMTIVPKVWRRLLTTYLGLILAVICYSMVAIAVLFLCVFVIILTGLLSNSSTIAVGFASMAVWLVGLVYMSFIWWLANVVSVLEDVCGLPAMKKSKELLRGKMVVAFFIFLKLHLLSFVLLLAFEKLAVHAESHNMASRVVLGTLCFLLFVMLKLFVLVVQTVIYFVCKSYHHENIDKSTLSDHLEVYHAEYVPLKVTDVQLEKLDV